MTSFVASPLKLCDIGQSQVGKWEVGLTDYIWASFPMGLAFSDSKILL